MMALRRIALPLVVGALALLAAATAPAAYPGTNGVVAFTSTQDGGARHVFVTSPRGIVDLTGTSSGVAETEPAFSPDGREIAFTRGAPGLRNTQVFVMSASGGGRTQLTKTPTGNSDPTWSPDGTRLAFVSNRDGGQPNIFVMRSDGTGVRQITHDSTGKSDLAWSPAGGLLAFVDVPAGGGDREIYSIRTDGRGLRDLSNDPLNYDLQPAWSPDGSRIAYTGAGHPHESVGADLWIMNADGSGQEELHHEGNGYSDGGFPAWSPDGTTIAFAANNGSGYLHLWSVPAAGGQDIELVANRVQGGNPNDEEVDWQPNPSGPIPRSVIKRMRIDRHKGTVTFTFRATGPATGYRCALRAGEHRAVFKSCRSPRRYTHLGHGRYVFAVVASGPGEPYRTAATRRFAIQRR